MIMYEINEDLRGYYLELEPSKRERILSTLTGHESYEFLSRIYQERYSDHEGKGRKNIDWWLWRSICLLQLYDRGGLFRRFREREMTSIIEELFMNDNEEKHINLLYHEYRNVSRRYLSTCRSSNYASRMMGLRQATDEEKALKACEDIWRMSAGIARVSSSGSKMGLWCEALHDELLDYDEVCREEYDRLSRRQQQ